MIVGIKGRVQNATVGEAAIKDDDKVREWISKRANDTTLKNEQRAEAYVYQLTAHRLGRLPDETRKAFNRLHQRIISVRAEQRKRKKQQG